MNELNEQELIRYEKIKKLKKLRINPYSNKFKRNTNSKKINERYSIFTKDDLEKREIRVSFAGRIMQKREMGKACFLNIEDRYGTIQVYLSNKTLTEHDYEVFKICDIGDIVGIEGKMMRTKTDELTIKCFRFYHLTKSLKTLPEKYHGLKDVEELRRKRYLDLIVNKETKEKAIMRTQIIKEVRTFFDAKGFLEVETPVLQPILGGAAARPFSTFHNALDMPFYLRIATELHLKRLIVGGLEAVYEIGRLFRNEGVDSRHNPEFTTIEAYLAYANFYDMMDIVENLFNHIFKKLFNSNKIVEYGEYKIDFSTIKRVHMVDLIKEKTGINFFDNITFEKAKELAKEFNIDIKPHYTSTGYIINEFFEKYCEDALIQPTIVYGHPIEISPLARCNDDDPRFTDRFELFIAKMEFANAFSELNDPIDQKNRFLNQLKEKELGNDEASELDEDFIEALSYGMPPCAGIGIGIDRLVMLLTNTLSIRDVLLFPHNKNK